MPGWVRDWCRKSGRELFLHRLPASVPGHRPESARLLTEIVASAAEAVLVIPPRADGGAATNVTAALHDLPDGTAVLAAAVDAAHHLGRPLVLTHGLPISFAERSVGLRSALDHARRLLTTAEERVGDDAPDIRIVTRLVRAHPHELVGEYVDTGLLVVGGARCRMPDDLGLVARSALNHATCPLLVVPR